MTFETKPKFPQILVRTMILCCICLIISCDKTKERGAIAAKQFSDEIQTAWNDLPLNGSKKIEIPTFGCDTIVLLPRFCSKEDIAKSNLSDIGLQNELHDIGRDEKSTLSIIWYRRQNCNFTVNAKHRFLST